MQKKQQTRHGSEPVNIMATILQSIPKEAAVTKIEYEGPRIALYTNSPKFLLENHTIISKLVGMIKKRIVVRTDQSIRKTEDEARKLLITLVPKDAKLQATIFDTATGEVSLEAKRQVVVANQSANLGNDSYGVFAPGLTPQSIRILLSPVLSSIEERPT